MTLEDQIACRFPAGTVERAERLVPHVAADPEHAATGYVKKSFVLRLAVLEGLSALERCYGLAAPGRPATKRRRKE